MTLEPLLEATMDLEPAVEIGRVPSGTRVYHDVVGGRVEGDRIRGTIPAGGSYWALVDESGHTRFDARYRVTTDDRAAVAVRFGGILEPGTKLLSSAAEGRAMAFGETYFMAQASFESGAPRYAWLNWLVAVAEGRFGEAEQGYRLHYRVFAVRHG